MIDSLCSMMSLFVYPRQIFRLHSWKMDRTIVNRLLFFVMGIIGCNKVFRRKMYEIYEKYRTLCMHAHIYLFICFILLLM